MLKVPITITNKKIGLIVVSKQCEILMSSQLPLYIFSVKDTKKKVVALDILLKIAQRNYNISIIFYYKIENKCYHDRPEIFFTDFK